MSSNPTIKKLATKIKDLELKPAAYENGAFPRLISEEFRRLANRSRDMIYRYDLTTRQFLFVNKMFLEFYSIDVEGFREATAKSVLSSIYREDRDRVKKARDESLASGSTGGEVEYRQLRPDGSLHWMHDQWIIITDKTGNPVIIEGIVRDITERKRAEAALKASEEKYRTLFESSRDAIMTLAPPSWRFTAGNPATVEMFATGNETAFIALEPWELSPEFQPDGRLSSEKAAEMIHTAMAKGSHFFEWTHRRLGGESFPATVLLTRMEIGGQALLQATVRDMTESRRMEEALRKSEK